MKIEISWGKNNAKGFYILPTSVVIGVFLAAFTYLFDGIAHFNEEIPFKEKAVVFTIFIIIFYLDVSFEKIASDRRDKFACFLKAIFCGLAFAIAYWTLFLVRGAPGFGIFLAIFVTIARYMALRYGNGEHESTKEA